MGKLMLINEIQTIIEELKALAAQNRSALLGPQVLLEYEVSSLSEALKKAKQEESEEELQQCLQDGKRLLAQLRQTHLLEETPK